MPNTDSTATPGAATPPATGQQSHRDPPVTTFRAAAALREDPMMADVIAAVASIDPATAGVDR